MNYHIIPQDKFFHSYIEDIYKLQQEDNNVFWVRGNKGDSVYFQTTRPVVYIGNECDSIVKKLRLLQPNDKLIVSWYDLFIGKCILKSNISNALYVYLMGGDFYDDPPGYHNNWLYDSRTLEIVKRIYEPKVNFLRRPRNWGKIYKEIKQKRLYKRNILNQYSKKLETIERIDHLITAPGNQSEISLIRKLYPTFKADYLYGVFDQNVDLANVLPTNNGHHENNRLKILLGNSADPTNNHIDACLFLKNRLPYKEYDFYSPLSYGNENYSNIYQKCAFKLFDNCFHPITEFMNRDKYISFLDTMDVVVMFHNRQQAYGNIITSLTLGKPVFIKKENASYRTFKSLGITSIYNVDEINNTTIFDAIINAQKDLSKNRALIADFFSEKKRLSYLSKII